MSEEIPQWARERANALTRLEGPMSGRGTAFARYIAQHEQPPVDPDVIAVRDILATYIEEMGGDAWQPMRMRDGRYDGELEFAAALAAYRKHKEAGK